jgi:hypothetical protein
MSDSEMIPTPVSEPKATKGHMDKVPEYYGKRDQLDAWLLHCDLHFHVYPDIESDDKGVLASTRLRGDAFEWIRPQLQRYMDGNVKDPENTHMFEDWDEFKRKIQQVFGSHKEDVKAERDIQHLKQTHSVADFANRFRQHAVQIGWGERALKRMFRQGLKPQVLEEIMRTSVVTDTLDQLINEAIRIDNELYQLRLEVQGHRRENHQPNKGKRRQDYVRTTTTRRTAGHYTSNGPEQMHLDSVSKEAKPWKVENKGKSKKDVVCYGCGKKGHFARDCRSKNKVTRHVNVIGHRTNGSETDEEPWEIVAPMEGGYDMLDAEWENAAWTDVSTSDVKTSTMEHDKAESNKENIDPMEAHPGTRVYGSWDHLRLPVIQEQPKLDTRHATMGERVRGQGRQRKSCDTCRKRKNRCEPSPQRGYCMNCYNDGRPCTGYGGRALDILEVPRVEATSDDQNKITMRLRWEEMNQQEREGKTIVKCVPPGEDSAAIRYDDDYRNPTHASLNYRYCTYDYCDTHYEAKIMMSHFPLPKGSCRRQWFDCHKDICKNHLWDKRTMNYFPGHNSAQIAKRGVTVNGQCLNEYWQTCMNPDCVKHEIQKKNNGFDEHSFLERNKKLNLKISSPPRSGSDQEDSEPYATSEQEHSRYE